MNKLSKQEETAQHFKDAWDHERKSLIETFSAYAGPELNIGFLNGEGPLSVLNLHSGQTAYRVLLSIECEIRFKEILVLQKQDELQRFQTEDGKFLNRSDFILSDAHKSNIKITCLDSESRHFEYIFEPQQQGGYHAFRFMHKHCVGRVKPS